MPLAPNIFEAKVYPGKPEALAFWLALGAFVWSRRLA
jgi:hypothetical protein